jgi:serine/threonine-protein kinase
MDNPNRPVNETEFENLLIRVVEQVEQGKSVDRDQFKRDFPQHAAQIFEFLDQRIQVEEIIRGTVDHRPNPDRVTVEMQQNSVFETLSTPLGSLGRLTAGEFPIRFGGFWLLAEIDRGGMGIVFKAQQETPNRIVALKVMRSAELASDEDLKRFRSEAESLAAIVHPNIVPIFEVGEVQGLLYFTMAYVNGESLSVLARERRLTIRESVRIMAKVTQAISTAHQFGIVHRDLKPSNILLDENLEPFVIDFGLAKHSQSREALTRTDQILGTPTYMAPEQAKGRGMAMSPATDVYALGAVLYSLVTGQPPFSGPTPFDILLQVIDREPPAPRLINKTIPRDVETIVHQAMEKDVRQRYANADELLADLQRFLVGEPVVRPKYSLSDRVSGWWRREPVLATHLAGIAAVLITVIVSSLFRGESASHALTICGLLCLWGIGSFGFQRLATSDHLCETAYSGWAIFDVAIVTLLVSFASPPRGLLLIGYPAMISASGLFYRTRFVVLMTSSCMLGFASLWLMIDDPSLERTDFCIIFLAGLMVLGLALQAMIRRVRGLSEYFSEQRRSL